ncbi:hypothetical protein K9M41_00830 [Candidatus Gracilibacteria bacterium]|nr:hypothetical protein [Candidatus Gracilibacteria bacterium]
MVAHLSSLQARQSLRSLGFSENEIKVISFLFRQKKATAREISQITTISFSSVQYCLSNLTSSEIISCLPGKEDFFQICSEKYFFRWIEEQKKNNQNVYENAKKNIHSFISAIEGISWKPEVLYYEGKEGIVEIYKDMLETAAKADKNIYSWLDIPVIKKVLGDYLYEYIKDRMRLGITSHDIVPKNAINKRHANQKEKRKIKFVDNLPIKGEIRIFGNKVAVITFDRKNPVGFVFQGEIITSLFKAIFESQWKNLK